MINNYKIYKEIEKEKQTTESSELEVKCVNKGIIIQG